MEAAGKLAIQTVCGALLQGVMLNVRSLHTLQPMLTNWVLQLPFSFLGVAHLWIILRLLDLSQYSTPSQIYNFILRRTFSGTKAKALKAWKTQKLNMYN